MHTRTWLPRRLALLVVVLALPTLALAVAAVDPTAQPAQAQESDQRPNVLFIVTDDQRQGMMSSMPRTLQYFQKEGRRYPNAFATTPLCCPARASIMTGRYAHNHGIKHNGSYPDIKYDDMLQAELQQIGYDTALYGKYLNAWPLSKPPPNFTDFAVARAGYWNQRWNHNGTVGEIRGYNADVVGDFAVDFIHRRADSNRPWFMMLAPYGPHAPYTPEPAYSGAYVPPSRGTPGLHETDLSDKPRWIRRSDDVWDPDGKRVRRKQLRTLMSVDDMVTRVMSELRRTGETNTIAVFLSDNGYMWGEHGYIGKGPAYTESIKVPFYVRWPGRIKRGTVDNRLVANIDLTPTVLKAVGLSAADRDGRNLLNPRWARNRMHLEYWCNKYVCHRWASTRTKRYQYIEHYDAEGKRFFREYYNLVKDPHQLVNLYADKRPGNNPPNAALRARLRADRRCVNDDCP